MISRICSSFVGPTNRLFKTLSSVARVGLMGIREDRNSSFLQGPSKAPTLIRNAFLSDAFNTWSELGINSQEVILDFGDVVPAENSHDGICRASHPVLSSIQSADLVPLVLGGDHSVSFSICKSISSFLQKPLTIVHFDAHPDIYDSFNGSLSSHASPFARICEDPRICSKLISIGIRTATKEQREQTAKFNVDIIEARHFPAHGGLIGPMLQTHIGPDTAVYISVDIDVIEPGLAPGVSHREAGGLTPRQLIDAIHAIPGRIVGADLVEYNPDRDVQDITACVAGKLLKELAAKIALSNTPPPSSSLSESLLWGQLDDGNTAAAAAAQTNQLLIREHQQPLNASGGVLATGHSQGSQRSQGSMGGSIGAGVVVSVASFGAGAGAGGDIQQSVRPNFAFEPRDEELHVLHGMSSAQSGDCLMDYDDYF